MSSWAFQSVFSHDHDDPSIGSGVKGVDLGGKSKKMKITKNFKNSLKNHYLKKIICYINWEWWCGCGWRKWGGAKFQKSKNLKYFYSLK